MAVSAKGGVSFKDSVASVQLDLIRATAAFLVLISHWKAMFFVDYPQIPAHRAWFAVPYVLCTAGHVSVLIFFVLSGYLIGGSIFRSLDRDQWEWKTYLTHRFVRLWVVLLPGLLLGLLWDWISIRTGHRFYPRPSGHTMNIDRLASFTPAAFFGNAGFLQTILVPTFGSNGALWSLANEFWYYILFPLGFLGLRRGTAPQRRILYLALLLGVGWAVRVILPLFPIWLAGTALAVVPPPRVGRRVRALATVVYVPLIFLFAKTRPLPPLVWDYIFGAVTLVFLWIVLSARQPAKDSAPVRSIRIAAQFSYTLYVVHMPMLLFLIGALTHYRRSPPNDLWHDGLSLLVLSILLLYAYLVAFFTEFRTDRVRQWVEKRLDGTRRETYSPREMLSAD